MGRIIAMVCSFFCAILQFFNYIRSRDSLYLTLSAGFVVLGILYIRRMLKEEKKDETEE